MLQFRPILAYRTGAPVACRGSQHYGAKDGIPLGGRPREAKFSMQQFSPVREWHDIDVAKFRNEIAPLREPAILRGLAASWPAVQAAGQSNEALRDYLLPLDNGKPTPAFLGPPEIKGRFWYREDMRGFNYQQSQAAIGQLLQALVAAQDDPNAPSLYAGAVPVAEHIPAFARDNDIDLPGTGAVARMWIGNRATVSTHFDLSENIAVVVAGHRRFTLFPPEQVQNLYVGPFDFTFAGPPVSMANLREPDLGRYPRFAEALKNARVAELEPGDAIFVPYMWWHHVEALDAVNVLLNYWWELTGETWKGSPFKALMHAIMSIRDLPERERSVWRAWFDHYVFGDGHAAVAHLPPHGRGALGDMSPEIARAVKAFIVDEFKR
ncbi:cupin-like domain-containing protein [Sphingomonas piscis]|uniref:Cupin-like domain-containing protein n=1 Tax=Sphingomonas piscis TaxID=2714943 RepID=A0A6G7YMV0_9SPHN|nr:cupin-like domain-containing protein [Sphingomonas piscis]QIK78046.1 cupin-like domain-containing protein [Sphingomonas piscis]